MGTPHSKFREGLQTPTSTTHTVVLVQQTGLPAAPSLHTLLQLLMVTMKSDRRLQLLHICHRGSSTMQQRFGSCTTFPQVSLCPYPPLHLPCDCTNLPQNNHSARTAFLSHHEAESTTGPCTYCTSLSMSVLMSFGVDG